MQLFFIQESIVHIYWPSCINPWQIYLAGTHPCAFSMKGFLSLSPFHFLHQKFIGSSQNGMHSLETRVHGLELALDEISYDLALSSGRMTNLESRSKTCCMLPGADFWSSKFWKKTEGRNSTSRFSNSRASAAAMRYRAGNNGNAETSMSENLRFRLQDRSGFIVNPLAEIQTDSRRISEVARR